MFGDNGVVFHGSHALAVTQPVFFFKALTPHRKTTHQPPCLIRQLRRQGTPQPLCCLSGNSSRCLISLLACVMDFMRVICAAFALPGDQRVPRNSDPSSESLSNSSDWNGLSAPPANGNNTSDSLSQDDDLGQCLQRVFLDVVTIVQ